MRGETDGVRSTHHGELATASWDALGTSVVLRLTDPSWLPRASAILARELDAIDRACSRFRPDSDLSRVNARAGGRPVRVAPLLIEALQVALRAAELTDGDVDPTVGAALALVETGIRAESACLPAAVATGTPVETGTLADSGMRAQRVSPESVEGECPPASVIDECLPASVGYDRDWRLPDPAADPQRTADPLDTSCAPEPRDASALRPPPAEGIAHPAQAPARSSQGLRDRSQLAGRSPIAPALVTAQLRSGYRTIELDPALATIRVPRGIVLDLGATAKAWAADRAARAVQAAAGCGVLVSLGGDIATAGPAPAGGWRIHVTDDHRSGPDAPGQTIAIASGALATSSTTVRRWRHEAATMHHVIDPSAGAPVCGPWRTVSVAAADCTDANIACTAALVRGARAPRWLEQLGLPARLVAHSGEVLRIGGWPSDATAHGQAERTSRVPISAPSSHPRVPPALTQRSPRSPANALAQEAPRPPVRGGGRVRTRGAPTRDRTSRAHSPGAQLPHVDDPK